MHGTITKVQIIDRLLILVMFNDASSAGAMLLIQHLMTE
jgi:hypothetical protein